jgi:tagatose-1,6-bisphosphate aldolase
MDMTQRGALRAQVAPRPHVMGVAPDAVDTTVADLHTKAAHRLTQRACHLVLDHLHYLRRECRSIREKF